MKIRSTRSTSSTDAVTAKSQPSSVAHRPTALRAAALVWMGACAALGAGTLVLSQAGRHAQAAPGTGVGAGGAQGANGAQNLEGLIATRTGLQMGTVLTEVKTMTGQGLAQYLGQRGTTSLRKSLALQKTRLERSCNRGAMPAEECMERLRETVQQQREMARLERMISQQQPEASQGQPPQSQRAETSAGEDAAKARIRLGAAVFFQQVREEVMPDYARANRRVFTVKKPNRTPASAGALAGTGDAHAEKRGQFETLGRSMSELFRGALGAGTEIPQQAATVEQSLRDFAR